MNNKNFIIKIFFNLLEKNFLLLTIYLAFLITSILLYCYLYIDLNKFIVDEFGNLEIFRVNNLFGPLIQSILEGNGHKVNFKGIDLYSARRPILPYYLIIIYENISTNFYVIHLIKNLTMGIVIFFTIQFLKKNYNNFFIFICLILIFYNPHTMHTMFSTSNEEGFLNYFIIILFFLITGDTKYKSFFVGFVLSLIFFTKGSMFILTTIIPLAYIFFEKKHNKYLPLIMIVFANLIWGGYNYKAHNYFTIGPTGSAVNALNLSIVYQEDFSTTYPRVIPDIYYYKTKELIKSKKITTEKELNKILIHQSLIFLKENPLEVVKGMFKKIYLISLSPFKDGQINVNMNNPIRYSNFSNKIVFNLSLFFLIINIFKKKGSILKKKLDYYYLIILVTYMAPYLIGFAYTRHCVAMYTIAHLYLFFHISENSKYKISKYVKK